MRETQLCALHFYFIGIVVIQNKIAIIESHKYNNIDSVAYFLMFVENFLKSKIKKDISNTKARCLSLT